MTAPDKLEHWQCHDMTREQLVEALLLRDSIIQAGMSDCPTSDFLKRAKDEAYERGYERGEEKGYEQAMGEVRHQVKESREKSVAAIVDKMEQVKEGVDELHRTDTPGPVRRVVDHLYWLLNFA